MAMALILSVPRRIKEGVKKLVDDEWDGWAPNALLGHRIYGKRLGILGMGRIGQAIAERWQKNLEFKSIIIIGTDYLLKSRKVLNLLFGKA